jgi:hypothetical protein
VAKETEIYQALRDLHEWQIKSAEDFGKIINSQENLEGRMEYVGEIIAEVDHKVVSHGIDPNAHGAEIERKQREKFLSWLTLISTSVIGILTVYIMWKGLH